ILQNNSQWQTRQGSCLALATIIHHSPRYFRKHQKQIVAMITKNMKDEKPPVRAAACETVGEILLLPEVATSPILVDLLNLVAELLSDSANDVKISSLTILKKFAKKYPEVFSFDLILQSVKKFLPMLVGPMMARAKER